VTEDAVVRTLLERFGKAYVRTSSEICILRVSYLGLDFLQTVILTWPQAKYVAEHPDLTDEDLVDEHFPNDWPRRTQCRRWSETSKVTRQRWQMSVAPVAKVPPLYVVIRALALGATFGG